MKTKFKPLTEKDFLEVDAVMSDDNGCYLDFNKNPKGDLLNKEDVLSALAGLKEEILQSDSASTLYAFSDEMVDLIDKWFKVGVKSKGIHALKCVALKEQC